MTLQITIPPLLEAKLRQRAAASGADLETFIVGALAEKVEEPKSFREIFAPLHQAFGEAPLSDEELEAFVDQARDDRHCRTRAEAV
jgi:hypothetical protein